MKYWNLKKRDKVKIDDKIYEFIKIDGIYGKWKTDTDPWITFKIGGELERQGDYYVIV